MLLEFMRKVAVAAGEICLQESHTMQETAVEYKSGRDLVTRVDRRVEDYIRAEIAGNYPAHGCLGEERGLVNGGSEYRWIIDPVDGTTSYVHGLPGYSVSIALQHHGVTVAGVVYAPVLDQLFAAERSKGAWLGGQRLCVSTRSELIQAVVATGFACIRAGRKDNNLATFCRVAPKVRDVRRHGSAALDLAWVAAGKLDGYWEQSLQIYDVAAGVLLVTEAGGVVSDHTGGSDYPGSGLVASNGRITEPLMDLINSE